MVTLQHMSNPHRSMLDAFFKKVTSQFTPTINIIFVLAVIKYISNCFNSYQQTDVS